MQVRLNGAVQAQAVWRLASCVTQGKAAGDCTVLLFSTHLEEPGAVNLTEREPLLSRLLRQVG